MGLVPSDLATILYAALGDPTDKDGNFAVTTNMEAYAEGYCACLQAGVLSNASGTISGTAPVSGGPITGGAASNGVLALVSSVMSAIVVPANPPQASGNIMAENMALMAYIMAHGLVTFASGNITGISTATFFNPGSLTGGAGTGGTIASLTGSACAAYIASQVPILDGPLAEPFYTALMNYTMTNAVAAYASGQVTGDFNAGGGPMEGGAGAGGTIS